MRLVRSVVDLPNVIYVLCYDSVILAHGIKKAAKVKDGKAYLEKIVQLTVMVPTPEPFQLRQWFTDELYLVASAKDADEFFRLREVIDHEGQRQLKTPRSVVRALDAVRFFWPPLRDAKADLSDLVWLQLIKDGNSKLYRWIEDYCATASVLSLGAARVDDTEKEKLLAALIASCPEGYFDDYLYRFNFASQLPGVGTTSTGSKNSFNIFQHVGASKRDDAIHRKRLTSPDHYRLYFALSGPSHAVTREQFTAIQNAAQAGPQQAGQELLKLQKEPAAGSLSKADMLLERIKTETILLSPAQRMNLLISFSQVMDQVYRVQPFDEFYLNSLWSRAEFSIKPLLGNLKPTSRRATIKKMFAEGEALGWLTSIFRRETFAHGRITKDRARPETDWIFSDAELDAISKVLIGRYRSLTVKQLTAIPNPIGLLFAWRQGGDEKGPRTLLRRSIRTDAGLVAVLESMTTNVSSSNRGNYQAITRNNIEPFLNYNEVFDRLNSLTKESKLGARAKKLLSAFKNSDDAEEPKD